MSDSSSVTTTPGKPTKGFNRHNMRGAIQPVLVWLKTVGVDKTSDVQKELARLLEETLWALAKEAEALSVARTFMKEGGRAVEDYLASRSEPGFPPPLPDTAKALKGGKTWEEVAAAGKVASKDSAPNWPIATGKKEEPKADSTSSVKDRLKALKAQGVTIGSSVKDGPKGELP